MMMMMMRIAATAKKKATTTLVLLLCLLTTTLATTSQAQSQSAWSFLRGGGHRELQTTTDTCVQDILSKNSLTCSSTTGSTATTAGSGASGPEIVAIRDVQVQDDGCQFEGDDITFKAKFDVQAATNSDVRDIRFFVSSDGDPNSDGAESGQCSVFEECMIDATAGVITTQEVTISAKCVADPNTGFLKLSYSIVWRDKNGNKDKGCRKNQKNKNDSAQYCSSYETLPITNQIPVVGSGYVIGDPHFRTWHGRQYEYMGICDLVLLRTTDLDIHVRAEEMSGGASYITSAVIRMGGEANGDKLQVNEDGSYYWNDVKDAPLPSVFGGDGGYYAMSYTVVDGWLPMWDIVTPTGARIFVQVFAVMVDVKLSDFQGHDVANSVGLMGSFATGQLLDRQGEPMDDSDTDRFGTEWQVRDTESMLFHEVREPQYPTLCRVAESDARSRNLDNSIIPKETAQSACASVLPELFDACVHDVLITENVNVANRFSRA